MPPPTSMICPGCGYLINTDEKRCPHCGAYNPNLWGLGTTLNRLFGGRIDVLTLIPTACIALYAVSLLLDLNAALSMRGGLFGMLSPDLTPLIVLGMTYGDMPLLIERYGNALPLTVLTATYLHGSLLHILFNVLWIRQLGPEVGHFFGPARYFIIYTVAGAVGFILSNLLLGAPTVGASGAIFGLFAAIIVYGRSQKTQMMSLMTRQMWQWAILLFVMGFLMSGVNNWAHLGGFIGGWIAAQILVSNAEYREGRITILIALLCLLLTVLGFVLSIVEYFPLLLS